MVRLRPEDRGLWQRAVRDVAPLPGRRFPPDADDDGRAAAGRRAVHELRQPAPADRRSIASAGTRTATAPAPPLDRFAGVDRATADRVRRGRYPVERRLDLHGMTQAEAHSALRGFVERSRATGKRCVLVITGHGRLSGGVLKAAVPRWLAEPGLRRHLLGISPARPQDGGAGALYLLLRRADI